MHSKKKRRGHLEIGRGFVTSTKCLLEEATTTRGSTAAKGGRSCSILKKVLVLDPGRSPSSITAAASQAGERPRDAGGCDSIGPCFYAASMISLTTGSITTASEDEDHDYDNNNKLLEDIRTSGTTQAAATTRRPR
jgi:hypothetical protein